MAYARIRPKRGTAANWTAANPILAEGEIGFETPNGGVGTGLTRIKIGDGVRAWNDLPYAVAPENYVNELDTADFVNQAQLEGVSNIANQALIAGTNAGTKAGDLENRMDAAETAIGNAASVAAGAQGYAETVNGKLNSYMPLSGAVFTGNVIAYATPRTSNSLRNITVQDSAGVTVSTDRIVFKRG